MHILLIRVHYRLEVFFPTVGIRVAVPPDSSQYAFDLEPVGIGEQADGGLHIVGFDFGRAYVGAHHEAGLEIVRRGSSRNEGYRGRQEQGRKQQA